MKGDDLPVSAFFQGKTGIAAGTSAYEKRGIAINIPEWIPENCIQCNQCSFVCPHAAIRPFLLNAEESNFITCRNKTVKSQRESPGGVAIEIQVSPLDCTGCGNCADNCPSKVKSLVMKPIESQEAEITRWNYFSEKITYKDYLLPKDAAIKKYPVFTTPV